MDEIDWRELVEAIKKVVHCESCLQQLEPPVFRCDEGHITCSWCYRRPNCSSCAEKLRSSKDSSIQVLDQVLNLLPKPCKYLWKGCKIPVNETFNGTHEKFCQFRPIKCVVADGEECSWKGSLKEWETHVKDEHVNNYHSKFDLDQTIAWHYDRDWKKTYKLLSVDDLFFLDFSCKVNGKFVQAFRFVPTQTPTHSYYISMYIKGDDGGVILNHKMKAKIFDESESIENSDYCISFPIEELQNEISESKSLKVKIKITQKEL